MRISEIYPSVQGEGPRIGTPTTFVRFAGCNLRCPGWPCDTPHAIFPELYRDEWKVMTPLEITMDVLWGPKNVCFTGGEPLLQPLKETEELVKKLYNGNMKMEAFTNGSFHYPDWYLNYVDVVMDWKLPGSGEYNDAHEEKRWENYQNMVARNATGKSNHSVKFTVASQQDYVLAKRIWTEKMGDESVAMNIYVGAVWGKVTEAELVGWLLADRLPWKLNVQVHNYIWDREKRGI